MIPFRRSAILPGGIFYSIGEFKELSSRIKKELLFPHRKQLFGHDQNRHTNSM